MRQCRAAVVRERAEQRIDVEDVAGRVSADQAARLVLDQVEPQAVQRTGAVEIDRGGRDLSRRWMRIPAMADSGSGDGGHRRSVATQAG